MTTACRFVPLKGYGAFETVFKHGLRFAYRGVTGFVLFRASLANNSAANAGEFARFLSLPKNVVALGVTAKRRTRPAAMRNRIKRILRAGARDSLLKAPALCGQRASGEAAPVAAIVLVCNIVPAKPSLLHLRDVKPLIERIFQNVAKYHASSRERSAKEARENAQTNEANTTLRQP